MARTISRTIVALALSAALPVAGTIAVAAPAVASDRVVTFPVDGQLVLGPSLLSTSSGMGLMVWQTGQLASGSNEILATGPIELRQRLGDTWLSSTLPTAGMTRVSHYYGGLLLKEDPANGHVLAATQTDAGAWVWLSTDGGATFAAPRLLEGRWLVPSTLALDRRGGFYMIERTGTDLSGVTMAHFDATLSRLPAPDFSSWAAEKWVPLRIETFGDTPVGYFSNPNSSRLDEHLRLGAGSTSTVLDLALSNIDMVGTSTAGAISGTRKCDISPFNCAVVQSVSPTGVLGPEVQITYGTEGVSGLSLSTAPRTDALRAAYLSSGYKNIYLAESSSGTGGGWTQWKVFDTRRTGIRPAGMRVSGSLVGGLGSLESDTASKPLVWVTDTAPAQPRIRVSGGKYARRTGRLSLFVRFDGTINTEVVVRLKAGKRTAVRTLNLPAPTAEEHLRTLRTRLPKKFRRLAKEPKARMTVRATASAGSGVTANATTRISLRKPARDARHHLSPASVSVQWSQPNFGSH